MAFPGLLMLTLELRTEIAKLDRALDSNVAISQAGLGKRWSDTVADLSDPHPELVSTDYALGAVLGAFGYLFTPRTLTTILMRNVSFFHFLGGNSATLSRCRQHTAWLMREDPYGTG